MSDRLAHSRVSDIDSLADSQCSTFLYVPVLLACDSACLISDTGCHLQQALHMHSYCCQSKTNALNIKLQLRRSPGWLHESLAACLYKMHFAFIAKHMKQASELHQYDCQPRIQALMSMCSYAAQDPIFLVLTSPWQPARTSCLHCCCQAHTLSP